MPFPGIITNTRGATIKDVISGPTTERQLIIGTALDGPLNTPIRISDARQAERVFGPARYTNGYVDPATGTETSKPANASIPFAIAQALAGGCTDIYVVRATGSTARRQTAFTSHLDIEAIAPGYLYNQVTCTSAASGGILTFTLSQPFIKGGTVTFKFPAATTTLQELIDAVNTDTRNTTVYLHPETYPLLLGSTLSSLAALGSGATATLTGGTNGIVGRESFLTDDFAVALVAEDTGTFDVLLGRKFPFDVVTLAGLHVDDQITSVGGTAEYQTSIAYDFVLWLDQVYREVGPVHGVLGTRPTGLRSQAQVIDYIKNNLLATTHGFYSTSARWIKAGPFLNEGWVRNGANGAEDLGSLLSVVAGPDCVFQHPDVGTYTDNFHVVYASMLTTLPPEQSATWRMVPGIKAYAGFFPSKYAEKLVEGLGYDGSSDIAGKGAYVVLTQNTRNYGGPMVIFDDATCSARNQVLRQHQIGHVVASIHKDLSDALGGFINQSMGPATQAAMEARAENVLEGYVKTGALVGGRGQGWDLQLKQAGADKNIGVIRVEGELTIAGALRTIVINLQVRS